MSFPEPLRWSPEQAVGVEIIDAQHQELYLRAERLIGALRQGDRSEVEPLVRTLGDYVLEHFEAEEALMRESGFPDMAAHRAEHERFKNACAATAADFSEKGPTVLVAMTLHNWISGWLRTHLAGADTDLARWIRARAA
ncbi:MAG TPA: hemerythrin family protein [Anaeromyxobacteraceae bacterium]|nr:hemerythrin family protein [Anaeromyxobacteraceae bacterium]